MTDTYDLHFYFDPVCPFAWLTSKWVRTVAAQRDYRVDWRFISLRILNANIDYADALSRLSTRRATPRAFGCCGWPRGCARSTAGRRSGHSTRRSVARLFDVSTTSTAFRRRTRAHGTFSSRSWSTLGLSAELADALDDDTFDDAIRAETEEALALTGRDVGTPILHFQPPGGTAFFGAGDQPAARVPTKPVNCGTMSSRSRASTASPRSSAACGNGPSWRVSASTRNRLAMKRIGTAAADGSRSSESCAQGRFRNSKFLALADEVLCPRAYLGLPATDGRLGAKLLWFPAALLTTKGRRTGEPRTTATLYLRDGDRVVLPASFGGRTDDPAWYRNLKANPNVCRSDSRRSLGSRRA